MEMILNFITENTSLVVLGAVTLVEIVPIKINPLKFLGRWIGNFLVGDLKEEFATLKKDFEESRANNMRWNILNFARSCRKGEEHSEEEWKYAITQLKMYESFCKEKKVSNGVIEETAKYLRELYSKRLHKNDFS